MSDSRYSFVRGLIHGYLFNVVSVLAGLANAENRHHAETIPSLVHVCSALVRSRFMAVVVNHFAAAGLD